MKKNTLIIVSILSMVCLSIFFFISYHDSSFVKNNFVKFTGIKEPIIKATYNNDYQSYFEAVISNDDKARILQKFKFEVGLNKLKETPETPFVTENPNYIYYTFKTGYGQYGYILLAIEKTGNTLIMYEFYGD